MIKPKYLIPFTAIILCLGPTPMWRNRSGMPKENIVVPFNNGVIIEADDEK